MLNRYFDSSSSYPVSKNTTDLMQNLYHEYYCNPFSPHSLGKQSFQMLTDSRKTIAEIIGAPWQGIYFSSGATESINILIQGYMRFLNSIHSKTNEIIISSTEHLAVNNTALSLKQYGWNVIIVDVDENGLVSPEKLSEKITEKTALVSIISVNNEVGTIQPIHEIARKVKETDPEILFMTDSAQALGKTVKSFDLRLVDAFIISGHKIGAPKGAGCFYLNPTFRIHPLTFGGGQESGYRPGTTDPVLAAILAQVFSQSVEQIDSHREYLLGLNHLFEETLKQKEVIYQRSIGQEFSSPYISSMIFKEVKGNLLIQKLSDAGFYISGGAACSSSCGTKSRVLEALGKTNQEMMGAVRFSFAPFHRECDVIDLACKIAECIEKTKKKTTNTHILEGALQL